ncbi:Pao retrotransposon peptidase [Oesophagostomum dentatum]|uniref:Pao retrotransposon peptidase n=1 Tax=Oesophagostomum dentatum TaxID=61180 RepID=A0A0B1S9R2_OESDE|nr:Pao retrotransposon peptidase [Oesophagostomum dentatum]
MCATNSAACTRRTVLHTNASVYDPLGWLIPLTIQNKVSFQSLWKQNYDWEPLPEQLQQEWIRLCSQSTGFQKEIPRRVADKTKQHKLVLFSDASSIAMAACAYLCNEEDHHLLIAKSKLPKINEKHTIPMLEPNAFTLAARLARSVIEELADAVAVKEVASCVTPKSL